MKKINWQSSQAFNFIIEIMVVIVVFIIQTVFDRRLAIVFSGTKTSWMRVFGLIILGLWLIKLIIFRKHRFVRSALDWPVVSFLLCTTIASITSVHVYTSLAGFYCRYEGLTSWYLFGLFFFVVINYIGSFEQLKRIIITVVSAATIMSIYSILQRHNLDPYMWGGVLTWQRVIGTIGQPNFLAAYMLMAFFLILSMFLMDNKAIDPNVPWYEHLYPVAYFVLGQVLFLVMIYTLEAYNVFLWYFYFLLSFLAAVLFAFSYEKLNPLVLKVILGISLLLIYVCILYTQSRGGYMGLFVGMVLFALVAGRRWLFTNWKRISALGFMIVFISGLTMLRPEYSPFARFSSEITTEKEETKDSEQRKLELKGAAGSRGETWKSAFRIIADYPFFGVGPEVLKMVFPRYETELFRFKEAFHVKQDRCHNETFDVAVTKGLIAFVVYLWLLFIFFKVGWQKSKRLVNGKKIMLAGLLAAALSYLIQNQFSFGVVAITSLFWIIWAMVMVIGNDEAKEKELPEKDFSWLEIPWLSMAAVLCVVASLIYISFDSFRGDIWFKLGKTEVEMGRMEDAVRDLETSLRIFPFEGGTVSHLSIAYLNLSRMTNEQRQYLDKAVKTLEYGTRIDPYNADNFNMLSKIYLLFSGWGNPGALAQAKQYAEIARKIDPYYAEVYQALGWIADKEDKPGEAAQYFEKAFIINPTLSEPMNDLEKLYRRTGQQAEILKVFERALDRYSDNLLIMERVARLYLERNMTDKAVVIGTRMIPLDPKNFNGYIVRAMAYMQKGDYAASFSDLQGVTFKDPKNAEAHAQLARVYLYQGNKQKAKSELEQELMLDQNNDFAKKALEQLK